MNLVGKKFAIYIENGLYTKNYVGNVFAMEFSETGALLNNCWKATIEDFVDEFDHYDGNRDCESQEFTLASLVKEAVGKGDFSKMARVNLGSCSHVALDAYSHYHSGDVVMRSEVV